MRLLAAFIAGILLQWHWQLSFTVLVAGFIICLITVLIYFFLPLRWKYRLSGMNGFLLNALLVLLAAIITWAKDIRHNESWLGHHYKENSYVMVTLQEPLVEKTKSYKALAKVECIYESNVCKKAAGQLILYFKKDTSLTRLHYGSQLVFHQPLQEIKNAGNPGSFNYKRYSLFQGITHQVYLTAADFVLLPTEKKVWFNEMIFACRRWVIARLQQFISGEKEQGLAEALLIGYKDDLDKNLVQSYSNTGVVHVIAISGLHLALIYGLLVLLTKPLKRKKINWLRIIIILGGLWLFSILAGAQASVIRSAVMFTCIVLAGVFERRSSIYNTLALSAFLLLCYNPYWLWDVGFQLSYAAVLSIVLFFQPIYNWYRPENKALDFIWRLNAVTLAAQLLTLPISIYHFHQIPTLFLFTNLLAVPLSSGIVIGEIVLCVLFFIEPVAKLMGIVLHGFIYFMNAYVERLDSVSFSIWNGLSITVVQTIFLTAAVIAFSYGLVEKQRALLRFAMVCLLAFATLRAVSFADAYRQKKLKVYNVPGHQAIDIINGRTFNFIGDHDLLEDDFIRNFHIQPARVLYRIVQAQTLPGFTKEFELSNKHIALIDSTIKFFPRQQKSRLNVLILSKNPEIYISSLLQSFAIDQIVIDGSVPAWKARQWKRDCDSLRIPYHDTSEKGAFVMNL